MTSRDNVVELKRRRVAFWPLLAVCLAVLASLGLLLIDFRLGVICLALSVLAAFLLRALLPPQRAGLLVVRGRTFDLSVLAALVVLLAILAGIVPPPPG